MEKLNLAVGIIHDPNGLQAEWTWQLLNTIRWTRKKFAAEFDIDLDVRYYPKAMGTKEDSFNDILTLVENSDNAYCWIMQDHLVVSPFLFYHFYKNQPGVAVHGVHFNRHNVMQGPPEYVAYGKTVTSQLNKIPDNLICLRGFLAQYKYCWATLKTALVDFNGMYLADVLTKGGVFYPTANTVNKYLNPDDVELIFNFEGFRYLIDVVNINAITVPEDVLDKSEVMTAIREGKTLQ